MIKEKERVRKSEALTKEEWDGLKNWIAAQPTKIDAAETIGIGRGNLDRIVAIGTCKPSTVVKIREVLGLS